MDDETKITTKEVTSSATDKASGVLGISIRAWLAIVITFTVCANWTANMVMTSLGYTSVNITIPEPLYSAFTMVLGIYFGQQLKK